MSGVNPFFAAVLVLLPAGATAPPADVDDTVASALVAAVAEGRAARGAPHLRRDALLDAVAVRRARETAALPERRRFGEKPPIESLIRQSGRRRFARAAQYLAYQGGYEDDAATAVRTWRDYDPGWEQAMDPVWTEIGAATARAADGTIVIAVVFLQPDRPLPAVEAIEEGVVAGVNREREARGLAPLVLDARMVPVARAHSEDMLRRDFFDHVSPDGVRPADRVLAGGISFKKVAENILENRHVDEPVAAAVAAWMASPGHRANILDPAFTATAVGVAVDPDEGRIVFTQLFACPPDPRERAAPEAR